MDKEKVHRAPENHIETLKGDRHKEQVHKAPEICVETLQVNRDDGHVHMAPEIGMCHIYTIYML